MQNTEAKKSGPNFKALGLKSPAEVIDLLALLSIDNQKIISDERVLLNPKLKANAVMDYFHKNFKMDLADLPYLASMIKHDLKTGKVSWRKR
ncbi:MAG: hypothetical protein KJ811_03625 [Candidatus Margulisbacteria bacterium]|nr:hypothetical protein [Candidatus Margulisiibacteriota bacterium]